MITNIKLEYEDSDIELTLAEAKELYKDLHELFGKERVVSVPFSQPYPDFYRPSGPSFTTTTTTTESPARVAGSVFAKMADAAQPTQAEEGRIAQSADNPYAKTLGL